MKICACQNNQNKAINFGKKGVGDIKVRDIQTSLLRGSGKGIPVGIFPGGFKNLPQKK